jgi:hypothetical protein
MVNGLEIELRLIGNILALNEQGEQYTAYEEAFNLCVAMTTRAEEIRETIQKLGMSKEDEESAINDIIDTLDWVVRHEQEVS